MEINQTPSSIYLASIHAALARVFSMLDREPSSKTFGCADRVYWSWKFTDFPGARFQEIAYALAALVLNPAILPECSFQPDILLHWTKAAIQFWSTLQHRDGSFDEAYPYERSLAATAFTSFYLGQAFLKIQYAFTLKEQAKLIAVFQSAGTWLCQNSEHHGILSNHLAAAAAALDTLAEITSNDAFNIRRDYFVARILQHQSEEGWYEEYGGADLGYQTHTSFYLAYVWSQTKDQTLLNSLKKSIQYFWHFVHADGSLGGEYGSRNTRFFMPAGFELLAQEIPESAAIANFMRASLAKQQVVGLSAMDTYNIFPLLNNYFFVNQFASALDEKSLLVLPFHSVGIKKYANSGHLIITTPTYQSIICTSKGGVINGFSKKGENHPSYSNAGVMLEFTNGKKFSSQGLNCSKITHIDDNSIQIKTYLTEINQMLMSPEKFIIFRLINLLSALIPSLAYHLKNLLVKVLVRRKKSCSAEFLRNITWNNESISTIDEIKLNGSKKVKNIFIGGRFSAIHMGSSRYFEWQELTHDTFTKSLPQDKIDQLNLTGELMVNSQWKI